MSTTARPVADKRKADSSSKANNKRPATVDPFVFDDTDDAQVLPAPKPVNFDVAVLLINKIHDKVEHIVRSSITYDQIRSPPQMANELLSPLPTPPTSNYYLWVEVYTAAMPSLLERMDLSRFFAFYHQKVPLLQIRIIDRVGNLDVLSLSGQW